jgi:hypothetical protein
MPGDPADPPTIPGFVVSTFSPMIAAAAARCLGRASVIPSRTAVLIVTACGDAASATHVADAVDSGARLGPLLFFQSVPNAVAGHVAARYGLDGPVICLSPIAVDAVGALLEGLAEAALLMDDADLDGALVVVAEQNPDAAYAVLVRPCRDSDEGKPS